MFSKIQYFDLQAEDSSSSSLDTRLRISINLRITEGRSKVLEAATRDLLASQYQDVCRFVEEGSQLSEQRMAWA
jgi:hypothetical protein